MKQILLAAIAAVVCSAAASQAPIGRTTSDELIDMLARPTPTPRSLRNIVPQRRQIDLVVNFDFDPDRLQGASRPLLESLAQAMNNERLQAIRFKVEGHTDGKGFSELLLPERPGAAENRRVRILTLD